MNVSNLVFVARGPVEEVDLPRAWCCASPRVSNALFLSGVEGSVLAMPAEGAPRRSTFRMRVDFLDGQAPRLFDVEIASAQGALTRNGVQKINDVARQFLELPLLKGHRRLYEQLPKDRQWYTQEFQDVVTLATHFNFDGRAASDLYLSVAPLIVLPGQSRTSLLIAQASKAYLSEIGFTKSEVKALLPRFIEKGFLGRCPMYIGEDAVDLISVKVGISMPTKRRCHLERDSGWVYYRLVLDSLSRSGTILDVNHTLVGGFYVYPLYVCSLKSVMNDLTFPNRLQIAIDLTKEVKRLREGGWVHTAIDGDSVYLNRDGRARLCKFDRLQYPSETNSSYALLALGKLFQSLFQQELASDGGRSTELSKIVTGLSQKETPWSVDQLFAALASVLKPAWVDETGASS